MREQFPKIKVVDNQRYVWERVFRGTSRKNPKELLDYLGEAYSSAGKWQKESTVTDGTSRWRFKGNDGQAWNASITILENPEESHQYTVTVKVAKGG